MIEKGEYRFASEDELKFIKKTMPKGMVSMVIFRTKKTRMQVLYQLQQNPVTQDEEIITAFREIHFAVTQMKYPEDVDVL